MKKGYELGTPHFVFEMQVSPKDRKIILLSTPNKITEI